MIASLTGQVSLITPSKVILTVHGVGYEVHVTHRSGERLGSQEGDVLLHTYHSIREDGQFLYGFIDPKDKQLFTLLVDKVQGVGPKVALGLLDQVVASDLQRLITARDVAGLSQLKGIGKKTAERLIIDLHDLMAQLPADPARNGGGASRDAEKGLQALGYTPAKIKSTLQTILAAEPSLDTDSLIRKSVALLSGKVRA
jgi:Holliday junction DNA helicase RuvA